MPNTALSIDSVSKLYKLGVISTGTLSHDLNRWWHRVRGLEDPYQMVAESNVRDQYSESGYVWALKDVSFEVKHGEAIGIIGKNGAGKSTLLKILSKVTSLTRGEIRINGRIASLLEVGTGFHGELTGRENIFLNGTILGMKKHEIRSRLDEIIDFSGVERFIDTPVKRYSSGMYVRLAFAVAAHLEPEILIVDEVLAVGDAEFQKKAIGKMQDVSQGQGRTVLFVSHNMASIKNLCHKGVVINDGLVSFIGDVNESIEHYRKELQTSYNNGKVVTGTYDLKNLSKYIDDNYKCMEQVQLFCDNIPTPVFYGGCNFKFEIIARNKISYENLLYGFVIKNADGLELMGINNRHTGNKFSVREGETVRFITEIENFPIYKDGIYNVDLYWGNHNTSFEIIRNAFSFEVEKTDVFKTGCFLDSSLNLLYAKDVSFNMKKYD